MTQKQSRKPQVGDLVRWAGSTSKEYMLVVDCGIERNFVTVAYRFDGKIVESVVRAKHLFLVRRQKIEREEG